MRLYLVLGFSLISLCEIFTRVKLVVVGLAVLICVSLVGLIVAAGQKCAVATASATSLL